jgi:excisionase family DNA binding protein
MNEQEVAEYLGCDPETVARERRRGHLPFLTIGRMIRIREDQLMIYLERKCDSNLTKVEKKRVPISGTSTGQSQTDEAAINLLARRIVGKRS